MGFERTLSRLCANALYLEDSSKTFKKGREREGKGKGSGDAILVRSQNENKYLKNIN